MKRQVQTKSILKALQDGDKLTPLDALHRFDCFRLGARIYDLKKAGHPIQSKIVAIEGGKRVAEYSI